MYTWYHVKRHAIYISANDDDRKRSPSFLWFLIYLHLQYKYTVTTFHTYMYVYHVAFCPPVQLYNFVLYGYFHLKTRKFTLKTKRAMLLSRKVANCFYCSALLPTTRYEKSRHKGDREQIEE